MTIEETHLKIITALYELLTIKPIIAFQHKKKKN